jgi:Caspase domain
MSEQADELRRYALAAGTAAYAHLPSEEQLPSVHRDVDRMVELLGRLKARPVQPLVDPTHDDLLLRLEGWLKDTARTDRDLLVFYYSGHGTVAEDGTHYLLTSDTRVDRLESTAVATERLARVFNGCRLRHMLIVLDTCWAGAGADELTVGLLKMLRGRPSSEGGRSVWVIAATRRSQEADLEAFVDAFAATIDDERFGGAKQRYLQLDELVGAINARWATRGRRQRAVAQAVELGTPCLALPNPRYVKGLADSASVADLGQWDAAARGMGSDTRPGWYFTGRSRVLEELASWLTGPAGDRRIRVVTGGPGSGKTAVLARLVTLGTVGYRQHRVPPDVLREADGLPAGAIDVALIATGKSVEDLSDDLAVAVGLGRGVGPAAIATTLRQRHDRFTVVIDALNEAVNPVAVITQLLHPLVQETGSSNVRLLVGTQRHLFDQLLPDAVVFDLDDEAYYERADMVRFVERVLLAGGDPTGSSAYRNRPADARAAASAIAAKADRTFLIARTYAEMFAGGAGIVDLEEQSWQERPATLSAAFDASLARLGADRRWVVDLLLPLALAQGQGLPWESIWAPLASAVAGRAYDDEDVRRLLKIAGGYVVEANEQGRSVYRPHHKAFADHLQAQVVAREAHARITKVLAAGVRRGDGGRPDWTSAHPYVRDHLVEHAAVAGRLDGLLADPLFLAIASRGSMLRALQQATSPPARIAADVYRLAEHNLAYDDPSHNLSVLELAARCTDAHELAARISKTPVERRWGVGWARWRAYPHRRLAQRDGAVLALAGAYSKTHGTEILAASAEDERLGIWLSGDDGREAWIQVGTGELDAVAAGSLEESAYVIGSDCNRQRRRPDPRFRDRSRP